MARQKERKERAAQEGLPFIRDLKKETMEAVWAIVFFFIALFLLISAWTDAAGNNRGGPVGAYSHGFFDYLLGIGYYLLPIAFVMLGISFLQSRAQRFALTKVIGSVLFLLSSMGIVNLIDTGKGGALGNIVSNPLVSLLQVPATALLLVAIAVISLLILFDTSLLEMLRGTFRHTFGRLSWPFGKKSVAADSADVDVAVAKTVAKAEEDGDEEEVVTPKKAAVSNKEVTPKIAKQEESEFQPLKAKRMTTGTYVPPSLDLLQNDKGKPGVGDIKANANIIKRTLQNFGIVVEMDEISIGPSVTRYALKPAEGVKLSRIVGLQNDLALALAAHPIRIEAPIPGKSLVGIEIPNSTKTTVGLGTLLASPEFQESDKQLMVGLGKGISGKSYFANLAKMPHLLIAGATGSGKSVTIHTIITSLLYRGSPDALKFIMIDPKRVELTLYNKIPHLLTPVITDAKKAILALRWAAKEMDRRYDLLEKASVRDIDSYHKNILTKKPPVNKDGEEEPLDAMPYIVVVIDELADIMQTYPRELESAIVRLAQMSRAVGIHLILSTQRPSVNVITGLIKANVPARIALQVASQIDSRTILDMSGAEKLLGAGDMLYLSGEMSQPVRIQSAYISETELKAVVSYLQSAYKNEVPQEINITAEDSKVAVFGETESFEDGEEDDLYDEAKEIVVAAGKASTSFLQRKLRVGYARAARLIDLLEERGVVSAGDGAKPREVIGGGDSGSAEASEDESAGDTDELDNL